MIKFINLLTEKFLQSEMTVAEFAESEDIIIERIRNIIKKDLNNMYDVLYGSSVDNLDLKDRIPNTRTGRDFCLDLIGLYYEKITPVKRVKNDNRKIQELTVIEFIELMKSIT